jgi:hypothetical protein
VKLGGLPWFVKPSPGGGDIIVGIGRSERTDTHGEVTRYVGYTTATLLVESSRTLRSSRLIKAFRSTSMGFRFQLPKRGIP